MGHISFWLNADNVNLLGDNMDAMKKTRTVINQNLIQYEIKKRLNSGNACYHSV
jgi:hypothetical protein